MQNVANNTEAANDLPAAHDFSQDAGIVMIPLNRLVTSPHNQRKERTQAAIDALAANIRVSSLLQNLVVHPMKAVAKKAQTYGVAAGETRRLALAQLAKLVEIAPTTPVPCKVITEAEAIEASVAENDIRTPPHPAEQCAAYRTLIEAGRSAAYIAALFNVDVSAVTRRLKLAALSPKLVELWRKDEITTEQVRALALTDDHDMQERVWFGAENSWSRAPDRLRSKVTQEEAYGPNDCTANFVGIEVFEAAGGIVRRDLFSDDADWWYTDHELMNRLAMEKLATHIEPVKAQGWKWVEVCLEFSHQEQSAFSRIHPQRRAATGEEQTELTAIENRMSEIQECMEDESTSGEDYQKLDQEHDALYDRLNEIRSNLVAFSAEEMANAGVVVTLDHDGLRLVRGLIRAEDEPTVREAMEAAGNGNGASHLVRARQPEPAKEKPQRGVHSEKLIANMTAHRTAAVRCELARQPHVALATTVHVMVMNLLVQTYAGERGSAAQISVRDCIHELHTNAPELRESEHLAVLASTVKAWRERFPKDKNQLFAWLLGQETTTLLELLAVCTALSVNSVARNEDAHAVNNLIGALGFDMSAYWQPTRDSYLNHVSKDRIGQIVAAAVSEEDAQRLAKMKKGEAASEAETLLEGKNWLPEFMAQPAPYEVPSYLIGGEDDDEEEDDMDADAEHDADGPASESNVEENSDISQVATVHSDSDPVHSDSVAANDARDVVQVSEDDPRRAEPEQQTAIAA
jgi:ParB family chromosome partitioning protein